MPPRHGCIVVGDSIVEIRTLLETRNGYKRPTGRPAGHSSVRTKFLFSTHSPTSQHTTSTLNFTFKMIATTKIMATFTLLVLAFSYENGSEVAAAGEIENPVMRKRSRCAAAVRRCNRAQRRTRPGQWRPFCTAHVAFFESQLLCPPSSPIPFRGLLSWSPCDLRRMTAELLYDPPLVETLHKQLLGRR